MTDRLRQLRALARGDLRDPLLVNPWLMLLTMVLTAGFGALFWVNAARLQSAYAVGIAGSLVATAEALAVLGDLGMNLALTRVLPTSDRRAADLANGICVVFLGAAVIAGSYVLLLPLLSPQLHGVVTGPWALVFVALVAGTSVNHLSDNIFLAINRVAVNLVINGVLLGVVKVALPFLLVGAGALGLFSSVGLAASLAAALSLLAIFRAVPGRRLRRPSTQFTSSRRFAGAGYLTSVLYLAPQLFFPLLVINVLGAEANGLYFVGFQIVTLLNALVYAICNSMYAEGSRLPHQVVTTVRRAGRMLALSTVAGVAGLVVLSPLVMRVFGAEYAAHGTDNLRILALGSVGVALNFWVAVRLRLAGHRVAMVTVQLFTTAVMLALAVVLAHRGIEWVAFAWGAGQLLGGTVGYVVSHTVAPLHDAPVPIGADARVGPTRR